MTLFRLYLVAVIATILVYTSVVITQHGINIFPIFFGDIAAMTWPGQFNLDFWSFLILGGLWLAWRHHYSAIGIAFGLFIQVGGMPFLATYLLVQSFRTGGDMTKILLGERRATHP
jgi:hypothetical protein